MQTKHIHTATSAKKTNKKITILLNLKLVNLPYYTTTSIAYVTVIDIYWNASSISMTEIMHCLILNKQHFEKKNLASHGNNRRYNFEQTGGLPASRAVRQ